MIRILEYGQIDHSEIFIRSTSSAGLFVVLVIILFMLSAAIFCFSASRLYARYVKANKLPPDPTGLSARQTMQGVLVTVCDIPTALCLILFIITVLLRK